MTSPVPSAPAPVIRFPGFTEFGDLNSLSIVVQELSLIYDVAAITVLPGYGNLRMPDTRFGPRRWSPLRAEDRLKVSRISLASPLTMIFDMTSIAAAIGAIAVTTNRILVATQTWTDLLIAGVDLEQRKQVLAENRQMAPVRLREGQLNNMLIEQQVRKAKAEADVVEMARDEILHRHGYVHETSNLSRVTRSYHTASSIPNEDLAELLDEPIRRLLGYGGGELEVGGTER